MNFEVRFQSLSHCPVFLWDLVPTSSPSAQIMERFTCVHPLTSDGSASAFAFAPRSAPSRAHQIGGPTIPGQSAGKCPSSLPPRNTPISRHMQAVQKGSWQIERGTCMHLQDRLAGIPDATCMQDLTKDQRQASQTGPEQLSRCAHSSLTYLVTRAQ